MISYIRIAQLLPHKELYNKDIVNDLSEAVLKTANVQNVLYDRGMLTPVQVYWNGSRGKLNVSSILSSRSKISIDICNRDFYTYSWDTDQELKEKEDMVECVLNSRICLSKSDWVRCYQ